jgi:hypothetical protein
VQHHTLHAFPPSLSLGQYAHCGAVQTTLLEGNNTVGESIQRVIAAHAYVLTGVMTCTALAHDDITCDALLATENLNTESLGC